MNVDLNQLNKEELLEFYKSNGFNLIPLGKKSKKPIFSFNRDTNINHSKYDKEPISYAELTEIFTNQPLLNVGVIMGKYSGNLFDIDIDEPILFEEKAPEFIKRLCQKTLGFTSANEKNYNPNKHFLFKSPVILNSKSLIKEYGFELRGKNCHSAIPWSVISNKENVPKKYRFINENSIYTINQTELQELDEFFRYSLIYKENVDRPEQNKSDKTKLKIDNSKSSRKEKPYGLSNKNYNLLVNGSRGERSNKEQSLLIENLKNLNSIESLKNDIDSYGSPSLKLKIRGEKYINANIINALKYLLEEQNQLSVDVKYALFLSDVLNWDAVCYERPVLKKTREYRLTPDEIENEGRYGIINHKPVRFNKKQNTKNVFICIIFHFLFTGKKEVSISIRNLSEVSGLSIGAIQNIIYNYIPKTEVIVVQKDNNGRLKFTLQDFEYIDKKFRSFNTRFETVSASATNSFNPYITSLEDLELLATYKTYFDLISSNLFNHRVYGKYPQAILEYCMIPRSFEDIKIKFNKLKKRRLEMILNNLVVLAELIEIEILNGIAMYKIIENSNLLREKSDNYFNDLYLNSFGDIAQKRKLRYQRDRISFSKFKNKTKSTTEKVEQETTNAVITNSLDETERF